MKNKYQKLMDKGEFLEDLSKALDIKKETLQFYFTTGKFPSIHYERIDNALNERLKADKEVRNIRLNCYVKF
jgi:hypothetical protein